MSASSPLKPDALKWQLVHSGLHSNSFIHTLFTFSNGDAVPPFAKVESDATLDVFEWVAEVLDTPL